MKIFISAVLAFSFVSCKTRSFHSEVASSGARVAGTEWESDGKVEVGNKVTYVYHWTNDPSAKQQPLKYLERTLTNVKSLNSKIEDVVSANLMGGHGIYTASDPLVSKEYGNTLIVIPILLNAGGIINAETVMQGEFKPTVKFSQIKSDAPAIVYGWMGYFNRAMVIRDLSIVDKNNLKTFRCDDCFSTMNFVPTEARPYRKVTKLAKKVANPDLIGALSELGVILSVLPVLSSADPETHFVRSPENLSALDVLRSLLSSAVERSYLTPDKKVEELAFCKGILDEVKPLAAKSDVCANFVIESMIASLEMIEKYPTMDFNDMRGGLATAATAAVRLGVVPKSFDVSKVELKSFLNIAVEHLRKDAIESLIQQKLRESSAMHVIELAHKQGMPQWRNLKGR